MENGRFYTTEELAARFRVKNHTARRAHCVDGHYMGIRPVKLPNGRLLWPVDEVEAVLIGR